MKALSHIIIAAAFVVVLSSCGGGDGNKPPKPVTANSPEVGPQHGDPVAGPQTTWKDKYKPKTDAWKSTPQVFEFNNGSEPEGLDPALITGVLENRLARGLFEGLAEFDPKTLEARPAAATHWDISEDGTVYTFHIRKEAKWSDGKALTSKDFLNAWKRVLTTATGSQYAYMLYPIKGAEAFHKGKATHFSTVGVTASDDATLVVTLEAPCPYFPDLVAFSTSYPVRLDVIEKHGDKWVLPENIVSNGPFILDKWQARQSIELVPNPQYWDREIVKLERVIARPYDDADTAQKLFDEGKLHWSPGIPLPKLDELKLRPEFRSDPYLGTYFYRFNVRRPPFNDARVRRALVMAVDRTVITDQVLRGGQKPATHFCPPVGGYESKVGLKYDKVAARALLKEAGYGEGGKEFPQFELLYNTSEAHKQVAEAIVQQWKSNLGLSVSLRNTEWKVYLAEESAGNYDVSRAGWIGDYGDPNTFMDMWVTGGGNNRTGWGNAEYDKLLAASQKSQSKAERLELFHKMEKILVEDECPILPIYIYVSQGMVAESVMGWYSNVRDIHPFKYIWLEE